MPTMETVGQTSDLTTFSWIEILTIFSKKEEAACQPISMSNSLKGCSLCLFVQNETYKYTSHHIFK